MRKSRNTKFKAGVKEVCPRILETYSALRKTCSRKISCFSKPGPHSLEKKACSESLRACFSGARAYSLLGGICFVGLLLIAFLAVAPLVGSVYAEEDINTANDTNDTTNDVADAGISAQEATISSVTFSFGDPVGVADLTPVSSNGASAKYSVQATVSVENSGGYVVYLGSNKSELVGKNTGVAINSVTSSSTYEGLPLNSWGYNAVEGEIAEDSFQAIPTNNRGDIIGENTSNNIKSDEKTFTLSFATHIGNDKPADTYENEVTMSVVSSPLEITSLTGLTNMQDMTTEICEASELNEAKQLKDVRDGKYYWVAKLADNKCWMTQNLDLDLGTSWPDANLSDYEVASTSYVPVATATAATTETVNSTSTSTRSWSLGNYVITNPVAYSDCGNPKNTLSDCSAQFTAVGARTPSSDPEFYSRNGNKTFTATEYNAHYLVGNFYQWNAATAGTGGTITSGQAAGSICPKGWRLPIGNSTANGSFGGLVSSASVGTSVSKLVSNPYYFVRGGMVDPSPGYLFSHAGTYGLYWSSTPVTNRTDTAYRLSFNGANGVNYLENAARTYGHSVRCMAR